MERHTRKKRSAQSSTGLSRAAASSVHTLMLSTTLIKHERPSIAFLLHKTAMHWMNLLISWWSAKDNKNPLSRRLVYRYAGLPLTMPTSTDVFSLCDPHAL